MNLYIINWRNCMCKISIIMPSLNVMQYIKQCMDSVLLQTLKDIEIICVDAGSTDGTLDILREYERKDSRVKVIISDYKSYGYQMNLGIKVSHGKYIGIVETDDFVDKDMFDNMYKIITEFDVDFVKCGYKQILSNGKRDIINSENTRILPEQYVYKKINLKGNINARFIDTLHIWSGLYKRDFLVSKNIRFNETNGASFQDTSFSLLVGLFANSCIYTNDASYCYRIDNDNSSVRSSSKINCIIDEFDYLDKFVSKNTDKVVKFELRKAKIRAYSWNYNRLSIEAGELFRKQVLEEMNELKDNKDFYYWLDSYNQRFLDDLISGIRNTVEIDKEKEDMAHLLIDTLKEGRRYSIVSAGTYANRIILLMQYMNIEAAAVYDNSDDKVGKIFNGYTIELIDNICNNDRDDIYIIANKNHSDELKKQLEILGIKKDNIKIFDNLYDWTRLIDIYNHIEST